VTFGVKHAGRGQSENHGSSLPAFDPPRDLTHPAERLTSLFATHYYRVNWKCSSLALPSSTTPTVNGTAAPIRSSPEHPAEEAEARDGEETERAIGADLKRLKGARYWGGSGRAIRSNGAMDWKVGSVGSLTIVVS